jgi:hypothetical protein
MITITGEQISKFSPAERSAWEASLSDDALIILHSSTGERYTLVFISLVKRMLSMEIPQNYRLQYLEWLDRDRDITPEMIGAVNRMCVDGYELLREAQKLGAKKALDVISRLEVFTAFVALNPSVLAAIKMRQVFADPFYLIRWREMHQRS